VKAADLTGAAAMEARRAEEPTFKAEAIVKGVEEDGIGVWDGGDRNEERSDGGKRRRRRRRCGASGGKKCRRRAVHGDGAGVHEPTSSSTLHCTVPIHPAGGSWARAG